MKKVLTIVVIAASLLSAGNLAIAQGGGQGSNSGSQQNNAGGQSGTYDSS